MAERMVVKDNGALYDAAQDIAAEKGISIGDAVEEATGARGPIISRCGEQGFRVEMADAGLKPPRNLDWMFGVLDNFTTEMVVGTKLEPYFKAKERADAKCRLLDAALENLANELATVPDVPARQESGVN